MNLKEILIKNSKYRGSGARLKDKLYKAKLKEPKCEECGQGEEWRGKKLGLHLEHVNGEHYDNRLENLRILCPNCHAITDTYAGKNKVKNLLNKYEKQVNLILESKIDLYKPRYLEQLTEKFGGTKDKWYETLKRLKKFGYFTDIPHNSGCK